MLIRSVTLQDATAIVDIYNHYVVNSTVTFETEPVSANIIGARITNVNAEKLPWLVAEDDNGKLVGYAYATKWRERVAYRFTVEVSVYVCHQKAHQGIGSSLYHALFKQLSTQNIHVAIGGITLPNDASIKLHEKFGMTKVAHFQQVGYKFEQWLDVGYWQKVL